MNSTPITQKDVIARSRSLPSFPSVVSEILATLDDPDGNFNILVSAISRDPLISARVLSVANTAAVRGRRQSEVCEIATAAALIGMTRLRHITLISSLSTFVAGAARNNIPASFWQHSVAVGVCSEELAQYTDSSVSPTIALIAGLLHDIGQLWLYHVNGTAMRACLREAVTQRIGVEEMERQHFGVDHCTIGAWLAQHWTLPTDVIAAIGGHHQPDIALATPLVPLIHVAEVISNALDLGGHFENHVTYLSPAACQKLGLTWTADSRELFGRIEARSSYAIAFFSISSEKSNHAPEL